MPVAEKDALFSARHNFGDVLLDAHICSNAKWPEVTQIGEQVVADLKRRGEERGLGLALWWMQGDRLR